MLSPHLLKCKDTSALDNAMDEKIFSRDFYRDIITHIPLRQLLSSTTQGILQTMLVVDYLAIFQLN